jgi:hypothetical protein
MKVPLVTSSTGAAVSSMLSGNVSANCTVAAASGPLLRSWISQSKGCWALAEASGVVPPVTTAALLMTSTSACAAAVVIVPVLKLLSWAGSWPPTVSVAPVVMRLAVLANTVPAAGLPVSRTGMRTEAVAWAAMSSKSQATSLLPASPLQVAAEMLPDLTRNTGLPVSSMPVGSVSRNLLALAPPVPLALFCPLFFSSISQSKDSSGLAVGLTVPVPVCTAAVLSTVTSVTSSSAKLLLAETPPSLLMAMF